jgi:hypothetical protein
MLSAALEVEVGILKEMLRRVVEGMVDGIDEGGWEALVGELCGLPAAEHLDLRLLEGLLMGAVEGGRYGIACKLCRLPAVQDVDVAMLEQLLNRAIEGGSYDLVKTLCQLPASQQYDVSAVQELWTGVLKGDLKYEAVAGLCCGGDKFVEGLLAHPAAQSLSENVLLELVEKAKEARHWDAFGSLYRLELRNMSRVRLAD